MAVSKNNQDDEMSLKELFLLIRLYCVIVLKKWWLITIVGGLCFSIGYLLEMRKPLLYTATTTFVLESGASGAGPNVSSLSNMFGIDMAGSANNLFQGESLLELYRSNSIIQEVLLSPVDSTSDNLLIQKLFSINKELRENIKEEDQLFLGNTQVLLRPSAEDQRQRDSILNGAVKVVRNDYFKVFYPNSKANIIRVDVTGEDEVFAQSFNGYIVTKVNDLYMEIKAGKSYQNIKTLQFKLDSVKRVVNSAISSSAVSVDMTPNLNPTKGALRLIPTQQAQISVETNKNLLAELNRSLEMAKLNLSKEAPLIKVIDTSQFPLEKQRPNLIRQGLIGAFLGGFLIVLLVIGFAFYRNIMRGD